MTQIATKRTSVVSIAAVLCSSVAAGPPDIELIRSTIDGGGVMRSIGGGFELSGTIGQPDAGRLAGGPFELAGGFWFEIGRMDCDEDGGVTLFDHSLLTGCLTGPGGGVPAGCDCFDVDRSGTVDLRDFSAAQILHSGS